MKYEIIEDCLFHQKGQYITIKKGSVYSGVPASSLSKSMKMSLDDAARYSRHTARWVVLDAEGLHRMFCVGKDCKAIYPK